MERIASICKVETPAELAEFESLVREYISSLPFPLDFQDVEAELAELPLRYGPPGGAAFLAREGELAVGSVAIRDFGGGIVEMKRMYVRPAARGAGHGRALCATVVETARQLGYSSIRLDTVAELSSAARIYDAAGFVEIAPYRDNPMKTARYYELVLPASGENN